MPTLERINPKELDLNNPIDEESYKIHLERYAFAIHHLIKGNVLDLACGTGYGSYFVAENLEEFRVAAVDSDERAITIANQNYNHPNIKYFLGNAYTFIPPFPISNIISLETIEHLENPNLFIEQISTFLQKGNRVIASVPITPSMDFNPYHLHDFTEKKLCNLFETRNFKLITSTIQIQQFTFRKLTKNSNSRFNINFKKILYFYFKHPSKIWLRAISLIKNGLSNKYFIAVFEKV